MTPLLRESSHPALYYQEMLADLQRNQQYRQAINAVVQPGDVVADLGTGLGVLAIMAAQAGASRVYAVEVRPQVIPYAQRIIDRNGFADVIALINQDATEVDLPEQVDVVVNELLGDFGTDETIHESVAHVTRRYLKPSGRVIPGHLTTQLVGVRYDTEFRDVYTQDFCGLDLSDALGDEAFATSAVRFGLQRPALELTNRAIIEEVDFEATIPRRRYEHPFTMTVQQSGLLQGLMGGFCAQLATDIELHNLPRQAGNHWHNWHWPVMPFVEVSAGQQITGTLVTPPRASMTVWRVEDLLFH